MGAETVYRTAIRRVELRGKGLKCQRIAFSFCRRRDSYCMFVLWGGCVDETEQANLSHLTSSLWHVVSKKTAF